MHRKITLLVLITLTLSLLTFASASANRSYNVDVYVNGELVFLPDQRAFVDTKANRTYVPLRFVAEALGAKVGWDAARSTAAINRGDKAVTIQVNAVTAQVNGKPAALGAPALLIGQRTYVPLRFVSEALGEKVKWEPPAGRNGRVLIGEGVPSGKPADVAMLERIHGVTMTQSPATLTWRYDHPEMGMLTDKTRSHFTLARHDHGDIWIRIAWNPMLPDIRNASYPDSGGPVNVDLSPVQKTLDAFFPGNPKNPEIMAKAKELADKGLASNGFFRTPATNFTVGDRRVQLTPGGGSFVNVAIIRE